MVTCLPGLRSELRASRRRLYQTPALEREGATRDIVVSTIEGYVPSLAAIKQQGFGTINRNLSGLYIPQLDGREMEQHRGKREKKNFAPLFMFHPQNSKPNDTKPVHRHVSECCMYFYHLLWTTVYNFGYMWAYDPWSHYVKMKESR